MTAQNTTHRSNELYTTVCIYEYMINVRLDIRNSLRPIYPHRFLFWIVLRVDSVIHHRVCSTTCCPA